MEYEKKDLRVTRTRRNIFEAFIQLVNKKEFDAITIQEIADEAMINRTTFYSHFQDKFDLADKVLIRMFEHLGEQENNKLMNKQGQIQLMDIQNSLTFMLKSIRKEAYFFEVILDNIDFDVLKRSFTNLIRTRYNEVFERVRIMEEDMEIPLDVVGEYSASIFLSVVRWWLKSEFVYSEDKLAQLLIKMIGNANLTVLGIEILR